MDNNEKLNLNLDLTISERFVKALTTGALMLVGGIALILLSPIFSIKALFTSKRTDWKALKKTLDDMGDKLDEFGDPDGGEGWRKDHKDQYGK